MQFYLDLSNDARRSNIINQLREALGETGWAVASAEAMSAGVPKKHHHGIVEVRQTIDNLRIGMAIKESLCGVYEILAAAEATVHECAVDETHFHEVGNGEGILNSLLICSAFQKLSADFVLASPVQTGEGTVECAHGLMDIPTPATRAILEDAPAVHEIQKQINPKGWMEPIPCAQPLKEGELCTPTSAAIIRYFVNEFEN